MSIERIEVARDESVGAVERRIEDRHGTEERGNEQREADNEGD